MKKVEGWEHGMVGIGVARLGESIIHFRCYVERLPA